MIRSLTQSLSALLYSLLCLLLVSGPAFAGASDRSYVAGHFMLELAGDSASLLRKVADDSMVAATIDTQHQKRITHLLENPVTENFILIGDARAKALAKHKPVPGFASIKGGKERTLDEVIAWSEESLDVVKMLREKLEDQQDSLKEMSEEDMLQLQRLMEQAAQLEEMISKVMKAASEAQNNVAGNLKAS